VRLTIVIPTLNRDYCVRRAVDSALAQTAPGIEVVVSNNGSSDRTPEILALYNDPRLRVFHHKRTIPIYDHANFLLDTAKGTLFVGLSDDDFLEPTFAERVLELYDRHPEISFAYTRCWTHVGGQSLPSPAGPEIEPTLQFFTRYFEGSRHIFWCACATRTEDLRRIGPLPVGTQIGDMHYWTQLAFQGPIGCIPELLAHYTYLVDNASIGVSACDWATETKRLLDRIDEQLGASGAPAASLRTLREFMARYLARTTANQLALNAARGAKKTELVRSLRSCGQLLRGDMSVAVPRVLAALILPWPILTSVVRLFVAKQSRWARRSNDMRSRGELRPQAK
jgi:hypothetical protein